MVPIETGSVWCTFSPWLMRSSWLICSSWRMRSSCLIYSSWLMCSSVLTARVYSLRRFLEKLIVRDLFVFHDSCIVRDSYVFRDSKWAVRDSYREWAHLDECNVVGDSHCEAAHSDASLETHEKADSYVVRDTCAVRDSHREAAHSDGSSREIRLICSLWHMRSSRLTSWGCSLRWFFTGNPTHM